MNLPSQLYTAVPPVCTTSPVTVSAPPQAVTSQMCARFPPATLYLSDERSMSQAAFTSAFVNPPPALLDSFMDMSDEDSKQHFKWQWRRSLPSEIPRIVHKARKTGTRLWTDLVNHSTFRFTKRMRVPSVPPPAEALETLRSSNIVRQAFTCGAICAKNSTEVGQGHDFLCDCGGIPPYPSACDTNLKCTSSDTETVHSAESSSHKFRLSSPVKRQNRRTLRERFSTIFGSNQIRVQHRAIQSEVDISRSYLHYARNGSLTSEFPLTSSPSLPPRLPEMTLLTLASEISLSCKEHFMQSPARPSSSGNTKNDRKLFMHLDSSGSCGTSMASRVSESDRSCQRPLSYVTAAISPRNSRCTSKSIVAPLPSSKLRYNTDNFYDHMKPLPDLPSSVSPTNTPKVAPAVVVSKVPSNDVSPPPKQRSFETFLVPTKEWDKASMVGSFETSMDSVLDAPWPVPPRHMLFLDPDVSMHRTVDANTAYRHSRFKPTLLKHPSSIRVIEE